MTDGDQRDERRDERREEREERREEREEVREEVREEARQEERDPTRNMVTALVTSLNDVITALRLEIKVLGDGEASGRRRTYVGMAVVVALVILALVQTRAIYRQGSDIKRVVSFIESCQDPEGVCAQRNQGQLAEAIRTISLGVFDSISCVLVTPPAQRTDATVEACRERHFPK